MTLWHGFGPAMARPATAEALRAGTGAAAGLLLSSLALWLLTPGASWSQPLLIAPFGASAFLIFVLPNSPFAQPWSVVIGNLVSALAAFAVLQIGLSPLMTVSLSVMLAVLAMAATRSLHPPGGAVALFTAMTDPAILPFMLFPLLSGSMVLVGTGMLWNRATGRAFPDRPGAPPSRRETEASEPASRFSRLTAADVMSRDLLTLRPDAPRAQIAGHLAAHRFKALPVTEGDTYHGLITRSALDLDLEDVRLAGELVASDAAVLPPNARALQVAGLIANGQQAVPIVDKGQLVGMVTRSDLIAAMARAF